MDHDFILGFSLRSLFCWLCLFVGNVTGIRHFDDAATSGVNALEDVDVSLFQYEYKDSF